MIDEPNRVEEMFERARKLADTSVRAAYLDQACSGDTALRAEIERLLSALGEAGSFLEDVPADTGSPDQIETLARSVDRGVPAPSEKPGDVIGRYKLLQQIGEGGFGVVYMAEQREPVKRRVALKIIKLGMDTRQVIARFEAERQALAMMDHPNIAKVFDAGATDTGRPYFVMEYIRGVPILEYCDTEKLDTVARLDLFKSVCHAIQHAHQKGIIHRDIKPSNVLITLHDGKPVPKVIDFGIAKATSAELTTRTLFTEHRQMIGTPAYMSPEQAEMSGLDVDTRSDIYSLGVLLYEMLTGTTPFDAEDLASKGYAEMVRIIREVEPHKPSTRLSTLGETATRTAQRRHTDLKKLGTLLRGDLDWIVMKCLEKDRTRRYETANGLAMDIRRHLNDEPVVAGPPSTGYRLRKFVRRNRGQVIAAGVVAAALLVGIAGTTTGLVWALREKDRAEVAEEATVHELARANEVKRVITEMLSSVKPEEAKGADVTLLKGILDETAARLEKREIKDELIAAELRYVVGDVYYRLGLYDDAGRHLPIAVEIQARVLGAAHPETLRSMHRLASLYLSNGRYAEAEALQFKVIEARKRVLGEAHPDTLGSMNNLALVYESQGRDAEAEALLLKVMEAKKRVLGEEHPSTLTSMGNLANVYQNQGRYSEAETLYRNALEMRKRVLGDEHPDTIASMGGLALVYENQGRYADAESLQLKVIEAKKRVLGEEHPGTLASMNALALVYVRQGRYAEAEALHLNVMEVQKRMLGDKHPDTLGSMHDLAVVYQKQRRYSDAEALQLKVIEAQKRVLGEEHPDTLGSMSNLANVYENQGQYAEAEALLVRVLEARKRVLGDAHPDTITSMNNLGWCYLLQEDYAAAEPLFDKALALRKKVSGFAHPETNNVRSNLIRLYREQHRLDDLKPLLVEQHEAHRKRAEGENATPDDLNGFAWNLLSCEVAELRDPPRALALAERACARAEADGDPELWNYFDTLALAQHTTGDAAGAVETQRRALSLIPHDHPDRADLERRLAEYAAALATTTTPVAGGAGP